MMKKVIAVLLVSITLTACGIDNTEVIDNIEIIENNVDIEDEKATTSDIITEEKEVEEDSDVEQEEKLEPQIEVKHKVYEDWYLINTYKLNNCGEDCTYIYFESYVDIDEMDIKEEFLYKFGLNIDLYNDGIKLENGFDYNVLGSFPMEYGRRIDDFTKTPVIIEVIVKDDVDINKLVFSESHLTNKNITFNIHKETNKEIDEYFTYNIGDKIIGLQCDNIFKLNNKWYSFDYWYDEVDGSNPNKLTIRYYDIYDITGTGERLELKKQDKIDIEFIGLCDMTTYSSNDIIDYDVNTEYNKDTHEIKIDIEEGLENRQICGIFEIVNK